MLTILTATYNRYNTLLRLYDSLESQCNKDFEWLVVDDGSSDDSILLLNALRFVASFPVRVLHQNNSGKHVAINNGVSVITNDWVFMVDSDDFLPPDAVEMFFSDLKRSNNKFVGYCYRKADVFGEIVGRKIDNSINDFSIMTPTQAGNFYSGDLAYVFMTSILAKYPFPTFIGEKFVPELLVWNRIADEGDIAFYHHKIIYFCEYLQDGYSANFDMNLRKNPRGFGCYYKHQFLRECSFVRKLKCAVRYIQCVYFNFIKRIN